MKSPSQKQLNHNSRIQQKASYSAGKSTEEFLKKLSKEAIANLYQDLVVIAEKSTENARKQEPDQGEIKCRSGCSHCCHMRVHVTPIEILYLAEHLKEALSSLEIETLLTKLKENVERSHGLNDFEYGQSNIRCLLLDGDMCRVYDYRPLECRGYVSFDLNKCIEASENYEKWNVPISLSQFSVFKDVQAGLSTTLAASDYEYELLEFNHALKIALETADVSQKWLEGQEVFSLARLGVNDPDVLAMLPWSNSIESE